MSHQDLFDVIVVGGGHAGIEAAMASSRIGRQTLLLTHNIDTLGQMSCNPAIGGIGKGHLVKEIDAMGGLMAKAIDCSGIHFKILNASKGPAVRATRAQADRILYRQAVRNMIKNQSNLTLLQQEVEDIIVENNCVVAVVTKIGIKFYAKCVVITVGTFLNGRIFIGLESYSGGRANDPSSIKLAQRLKELPLRVSRLKTGTPPRIDARTINFDILKRQNGDDPIPTFSFMKRKTEHLKQLPCYITYSNENTHDIIRNNLNFSPMYTGLIDGIGPRYCPSIEDKIMRFTDRKKHQIFLEPEGLNSNEIYPNGISTSLPPYIQTKIIRSIQGMEDAVITQPGYAIEYDFFDPCDLKPTLESKFINGLFFAGQINGTTGYEEAAAQGLIAGLNAALLSVGKDTWAPQRNQAYLGVMIDDLCTLSTKEPYRMFTSRAEYRLTLREDNADLRLTEIGRKLGLVDDERWVYFNEKLEKIERERQRLKSSWVIPLTNAAKELDSLLQASITHEVNGEDLLRRPEINYEKLIQLTPFSPGVIDKQVAEQIEIQIKYEGYIARQQEEIDKCRRNENTLLPKSMDYSKVTGLSNEVVSKLNDHKPLSIGQAARISGVTPAAISILMIWLKRIGSDISN